MEVTNRAMPVNGLRIGPQTVLLGVAVFLLFPSVSQAETSERSQMTAAIFIPVFGLGLEAGVQANEMTHIAGQFKVAWGGTTVASASSGIIPFNNAPEGSTRGRYWGIEFARGDLYALFSKDPRAFHLIGLQYGVQSRRHHGFFVEVVANGALDGGAVFPWLNIGRARGSDPRLRRPQEATVRLTVPSCVK
jgi:hypothetical protein